MFFIFRSVHKNFVKKLKIDVKKSYKPNCSYGRFSHDLKYFSPFYVNELILKNEYK